MRSRGKTALIAILFLAGWAGAHAQTFFEFALPRAGSRPFQIATGPDGNIWFTEDSLPPTIGRTTPGGVVTEFPIVGSNFPALGIAAGPDGNLWFTVADFENGTFSGIGRITPAGSVTLFPLSNPSAKPGSITPGSDGALWFTEGGANRIGRITTAGTITGFPIPTGQSSPRGITGGPDGNLWFAEGFANKIGRATPAGVITEFPAPTLGQPTDVTASADGNLWFGDFVGKVGRVSTSGVITEFPTLVGPKVVDSITAGPDGNVWFAERRRLGRITPTGVITEFLLPDPNGFAGDVTAGPDDAVWFTDIAGNKVGRLTMRTVVDETLILPVVGSTAGVGGSFFRTSVQLYNPGTTPSAGGIVFHPSGTPGSVQDPSLPFTIAPGETLTIPDLLPAMQRSGLGSADVILTLGSAGNVPVVSTRVFNDAGPGGTTGFALNALRTDEALRAEDGILLIPSDLTIFRFNIGIRTLQEPALVGFAFRNAAGAIVTVGGRFFPAVYHEQQSVDAFLDGYPLPAGGSIRFTVQSGAAIVYGATVDNRTGDPSLQIARPLP